MGRSNSEVVLANSEAFSNRDVDAMLEFYAPDAVVIDRRPVGFGEFRGREALRSYWEGILDNVSSFREDLEVVSDDGEILVASARFDGRLLGQDTGETVTFHYALRFVFAGGAITLMEIHEDADAAMAADR